MNKRAVLWFFISALLFAFLNVSARKYEPNWRSVRQIKIPQWLQDGKFGIYTHWGPLKLPRIKGNMLMCSGSNVIIIRRLIN